MEPLNAHTASSNPTASHVMYGLRIYTFGTFGIEWVDPQTSQVISFPPERLQGGRVASSWALFKALLGCPDRFAPRSWLLEQFWPTSKNSSATERLNDVASALRGVLRPQGNKASLVYFVYSNEKKGAGYRLADYPQIWCDADAFEWYVKHGMLLDQRGQDSTACWERAYALAERGVYLPEHVYEEWANQRREHLQGLLRDCVQRWTQLLRQAGYVEEAIMRLRGYWQDHPTDEDALRPLLEMLGERERFQEAEQCYEKTRAALQEDGLEPDEHTKESIEVVRALQIHRPSQYNFPKISVVSSLNEAHTLLSRDGYWYEAASLFLSDQTRR
jgi:DNA-binding SARP family transcriptional activator